MPALRPRGSPERKQNRKKRTVSGQSVVENPIKRGWCHGETSFRFFLGEAIFREREFGNLERG